MNEEERQLLIACSKAILQLSELVIRKNGYIDLHKLKASIDSIEDCLSKVGD